MHLFLGFPSLILYMKLPKQFKNTELGFRVTQSCFPCYQKHEKRTNNRVERKYGCMKAAMS